MSKIIKMISELNAEARRFDEVISIYISPMTDKVSMHIDDQEFLELFNEFSLEPFTTYEVVKISTCINDVEVFAITTADELGLTIINRIE